MDDRLKKKIRILVTDDTSIIREVFAEHLSEKGFLISCASDGKEAIEKINNDQPDLVLVDLMMPGINGLGVLKYIKDNKPLLPAIMISGTEDIGDVIIALREGAADFIRKPMDDLSILDHTINNVLEMTLLRKQNDEYQKNLEKMVSQRTKELEKALAEKDLLIQEIHHRVKNNLSLILAFMNIKKMAMTDRDEIDDFIEIQTRIFTMALLHEQLYENSDFTSINVKEYISDIVRNYSEYYKIEKLTMKFILDIEEMNMPLDVCLPLGLIINETIIEEYRYYSSGDLDRKLYIILRKENGENRLEIIPDNPDKNACERIRDKKEDIFPVMMNELSEQLNGVLKIQSGKDRKYTILFP